jgi:hypothetical protein
MIKRICDKCGKEIFGPSPNLSLTNSFVFTIVQNAWDHKCNHEYDFCLECGMKAALLLQKFRDDEDEKKNCV